ncbi:MAG: helix-turn-helix transcriptional regulator [Spirochaetia bacterium]|nr:helix-turn-helix transcriptional regulator [Spirochaetia bacterium]
MFYLGIDQAATGARIKSLCKERGIRAKEIQASFGLESTQAVYKWWRGESLPNLDNFYSLSRSLEIPINDMIVGVKEKEKDESPSL